MYTVTFGIIVHIETNIPQQQNVTEGYPLYSQSIKLLSGFATYGYQSRFNTFSSSFKLNKTRFITCLNNSSKLAAEKMHLWQMKQIETGGVAIR